MNYHSDILVVGGGPAGLAAAAAAAGQGRKVSVLDDNPSIGGQIWRESVLPAHAKENTIKSRAVAALRASKARVFAGRRVIDAPRLGTLRTITENEGDKIEQFSWDRLILATGARERFLPFPGWTLPGVFGAGGLQAVAKGGYSVCGKRVVVAGTGPLLLAIAAHLRHYGATVVSIAEQASARTMLPLATGLLTRPAKLLQGARYRLELAGVPYRTGCWPVAAQGDESVRSVTLTNGKRTWTEGCDLLACGFHLVPNTELATLLGCRLNEDYVSVDDQQQTSVKNIFCAGEPTGIAGLDAAMVQGRIAGLVAAGASDAAKPFYASRDREREFGRALDRAFTLRSELRSLATADTIVCRCEDVAYGQVQQHSSWTDAKLQTRCGMGPCQGRICGPAVQSLFGWRNTSIRPPLFPVPLSALCTLAAQADLQGTTLPSNSAPKENL